MTALFKKRRLNLRQALQAMEAYRQIPVQLVDVSVDAALQLAWELNIYAYDAFMVECAKRSGTPLLTLDIPLRISASQAGVAVVEL